MRFIYKVLLFSILLGLSSVERLQAQTYVKINGLYALVGVINPSIEFAISPKSTIQAEIVVSPWKSINGKHALFGIFMGEYRYYFKGHNNGWYVGGNVGMMAFNMTKPYIEDWKIKFENRYSKGYGFMLGASVGYEHVFCERWVVDAFLGWSWMHSYYNGYSNDGQIQLNPNPDWNQKYPDPFNASGEWYPNKIGVSIGYRIINPDKARR